MVGNRVGLVLLCNLSATALRICTHFLLSRTSGHNDSQSATVAKDCTDSMKLGMWKHCGDVGQTLELCFHEGNKIQQA